MTETVVAVDRPKINSESVRQRAAAALCKRLGEDFDTVDAVEDMAKALRYGDTGFELAKNLERHGWTIDDALMEELLDADHRLLLAHQAEVAEWVRLRKIKPLRDVGAPANITYRGQPKAGEIVRIDAVHANYTIFCPDLGHVRSGIGTNGIVIPFEDVHGLCYGPENFQLEMEGAEA